MNHALDLDQTAAALLPENAPASQLASEAQAAPVEPVIAPKRRGRPPGGGAAKKPGKPRRGSATKGVKQTGRTPAAKLPSATTAAFAVLAELAGDELAVAVHAATPTARALIGQLLKAGI
jgi:hypothetical protein